MWDICRTSICPGTQQTPNTTLTPLTITTTLTRKPKPNQGADIREGSFRGASVPGVRSGRRAGVPCRCVRRRLLRHGGVPRRVFRRRGDHHAQGAVRPTQDRPLCRDRPRLHRLLQVSTYLGQVARTTCTGVIFYSDVGPHPRPLIRCVGSIAFVDPTNQVFGKRTEDFLSVRTFCDQCQLDKLTK